MSRRRGIRDRIGRVLVALGRSLENPKYSLNDPMAYEFLGAERSVSGVRVPPEKALTDSRWWRGITLRASTAAKCGLHLMRRTAGGGKERATSDPRYNRLRYQPNAEMTAFYWIFTGMGHLLSRGNWYSYVDRMGDGSPGDTILLNPDRCNAVRENGRLWYVIEAPRGDSWVVRKVAPENILHVKGYGFDGLAGHSVVRKAADELGGAIARREHGYRFFRNGTSSRIILEHPESMDDAQYERFRKSWDEANAGVDNSFRTAIAEDGMKAHVISFSAKDAQLIEAIQADTLAIANFTGVPAGKLGHPGRTSYASVEQENLAFLTDTVDADFVNIESECRSRYLTEEEKAKDSHLFEFDRAALIQADVKSANEAKRTAVGGVPWVTVDEVRAEEGRPALGGKAAELAFPLNVSTGQPEEQPAKPAAPDDPEPEPEPEPEPMIPERARVAAEKALAAARARMRRRLAVAALRAAKAPEKFGDWLDSVQREHEATVRDAFAPAVEVCCALAGGDPGTRTAEEAGALFGRFRAMCDEVYDSPRSEFAARMKAAMERLERE